MFFSDSTNNARAFPFCGRFIAFTCERIKQRLRSFEPKNASDTTWSTSCTISTLLLRVTKTSRWKVKFWRMFWISEILRNSDIDPSGKSKRILKNQKCHKLDQTSTQVKTRKRHPENKLNLVLTIQPLNCLRLSLLKTHQMTSEWFQVLSQGPSYARNSQ